MAANQTNLAAAQSALQSQGIDWSKFLQIITAINVTAPQVIALVQSFLAALNAHPVMKGGSPEGCSPADLKAHFLTISALAECGAKCCDNCVP